MNVLLTLVFLCFPWASPWWHLPVAGTWWCWAGWGRGVGRTGRGRWRRLTSRRIWSSWRAGLSRERTPSLCPAPSARGPWWRRTGTVGHPTTKCTTPCAKLGTLISRFWYFSIRGNSWGQIYYRNWIELVFYLWFDEGNLSYARKIPKLQCYKLNTKCMWMQGQQTFVWDQLSFVLV